MIYIYILYYHCNVFQSVRNSLHIIHSRRHDKNCYYFSKSNIPAINLIVGSGNIIKLECEFVK